MDNMREIFYDRLDNEVVGQTVQSNAVFLTRETEKDIIATLERPQKTCPKDYRVDQIVGKGSKGDEDTAEDPSMMGRILKVEKQVGGMDKKLDFLVNIYVQRMGIPRTQTEAFFNSKDPLYPAPPYLSPEESKERERLEEVREEKEVQACSAAEVACSGASVEKKDPLLGQSVAASVGTPSGSVGRPATSWQHQLQHPLSQPAWNSSMANTPSPVPSREPSPTLFRLPPPPAPVHVERSSSGQSGCRQGSSAQSRRRNRRRRCEQVTVIESDTSISIPSVDHEELDQSFSGFTISQAKEDFFGPSFFTGGEGPVAVAETGAVAGPSLCARVRPFIAEGESDTDSDLYAPSPLSFTGEGPSGERPWPGPK